MQGEINCIFMVSILKVLNAAVFFSVFSYFAFCIKLGPYQLDVCQGNQNATFGSVTHAKAAPGDRTRFDKTDGSLGNRLKRFQTEEQGCGIVTFLLPEWDRLERIVICKKWNNTDNACSCSFSTFAAYLYFLLLPVPLPIMQVSQSSSSIFLHSSEFSLFPCLAISQNRRCSFSVSVPVLDPSMSCSIKVCCLSRA